jgi:hypothetical protein
MIIGNAVEGTTMTKDQIDIDSFVLVLVHGPIKILLLLINNVFRSPSYSGLMQ